MTLALNYIPTPEVACDTVALTQPGCLNIGVYRGDTGSFIVSVTDAAGLPIDVSAATWLAQIRDSTGVEVGEFTVAPVVGETSRVQVTLTQAVSEALPQGSHKWDLEMTLGTEVTTFLLGSVVVTPDVSRDGP